MEVKVPKGQEVQHLKYGYGGVLKHVITSDIRQERWYLYEVGDDGKLNKIETGKSPIFKSLEVKSKGRSK